MQIFTYPMNNGWRLLRPLCVLIALLLGYGASWAATIVDADNQVIYEIVDEENQLVEIYKQQAMGSYYDVLTIPATVTQLNTEDTDHYGKTYTVVGMQPGAFQYAGITGCIIEADIPLIPDNAFCYCYNLKSITLPENIKSVGYRSFYYCYQLQSISFTDKLESIGNYAFSECSNLTDINLESSTKLNLIGQYAFSYCSSLKFPKLNPTGELYIDEYAFTSCYKLGTVNLPQNCHLAYYVFQSSTIDELNIPSEGGNVFNYVSDDGRYYGAYAAFKYCTLPEKIVLPENVDYVPSLFDSAYNLQTVEIKAENVYLSGQCFKNIYALKNIIWPNKVKCIGFECFYNTGLESVTIPPCEEISNYAFKNNNYLKEITFPDTKIDKIGESVFENCYALTQVTLPDWMTQTGNYMFSSCSNLKKIDWPANLSMISEGSFQNTSLEFSEDDEYSFPSTLTNIRFYAFKNVPTLGTVKFPPSVKEIGMEAFRGCSLLQIPNFGEITNLEKVDQGAFMDCKAIEGELIFPPNLKMCGTDGKYVPGGSDGTDSRNLRNRLADGVFQNCELITKVKLNPGVTIGSDCFCQSGLTEIEWPESGDPVTLLAAAFRFTEKLGDVRLPDNITLPVEAFYWSSLPSVTFGEGITETGDRAFMNCTSLHYVSLGSTLTKISQGSFAWSGVQNLHAVPASVKEIERFAFWRCHNNPKLILHKGIELIGECAFCDNQYKEIEWPEFTEEEIAERLARPDFAEYNLPIKIDFNAFANNKFEELTLPSWMTEVPVGMFRQETDKKSYIFRCGSWVWPNTVLASCDFKYDDRSEYLQKITFPENIEKICEKAFYNNTMVQIGLFPSTITHFGLSCFENGGKKLTTEEIEEEDGSKTTKELFMGTLICPDGTSFDVNAFANAKIDKIEFQGCATFQNGVFAGMKYIKEIEFPECMTEIPEGFCKEWAILEKVGFKGNKITHINFEAFYNCPKLGIFPDFKDLPELKWIGPYAFYYSRKMSLDEERRDADYSEYLYNTKILDLSANTKLYYIGEGAFTSTLYCGIKFPEVEELKIGPMAFKSCNNLKEVTIPKSVPEISDGLFTWSSINKINFEPRDGKKMNIGGRAFYYTRLETVDLPDVDMAIGNEAFANISTLQSIKWPESPNRKVSIGKSCFYYDRALRISELHPSITVVSDSAFCYCQNMVSLNAPGVSTIGAHAFDRCSIGSLRLDNNQNVFSEIRSYAFFLCAIKHFSSRIAPKYISERAFQQATYFEDFIVDDPDFQKTQYIPYYLFYLCNNLKYVSDIFGGLQGYTVNTPFTNCYALRNIAVPAKFSNTSCKYSTYYDSYKWTYTPTPVNIARFNNCTSLQSIDFNIGGSVTLYTYDFNHNVPLKGVSYMHPYVSKEGLTWKFSVNEFKPYYSNDKSVTTNNAKRGGESIKLLVPRGTKQKFVKAKFEQLNEDGNKYFDVREIKNPVFDLHGEIHSKFKPGDDKNDYTAIIRWQLELSDLNENGTTELDIYRDDTLAARIFFEKPERIEEGVEDGSVHTTTPTYAVTYRAEDAEGHDVTERVLWDDFYYEDPDSPGRFAHLVQSAQSKVYFDAETTERLGQTKNHEKITLDETSWFLYKDRFESPLLSNYGVATDYTYTIHLRNYEYDEWANTDDYGPDPDTDLYWKWAHKRTGEEGKDWLVSNPCKLYTSVAKPTIAIDGMYSRQDVENDRHPVRSQRLDPTTVPENADYALSYLIEGGSEKHIDLDDYSYILQNVRTYKLAGRKDAITDHTLWGDVKDINGQNTGVLTGPDYQVKPNETHFQTVTYAGYRGSFGSPKVSLFGAPALEIKGKYDGNPNRHVHWDKNTAVLQYSIEFQPILEKFGYEKLEQLKENNYFIGLWRVVETIPGTYSPALYADDETSNFTTETLLWHSDGLQPQENYDGCDECQKVGYDHSTMTYTDRVPLQVPVISSNVKYVARLYVQKPDDATQYALAEAETPMLDAGIHTGIERPFDNVSAAQLQEILENGKLYNLQGVSIKRPAKGDIFVAIHAERIYKLRMP